MTSQPYTEHEKYANEADDYLDQHNIYELFNTLLRKLVIHKPSDPLSFMLNTLTQPIAQVRVLLIAPPHQSVGKLVESVTNDLGILRLKFSSIIAEEIASGSVLGKQLVAYRENNPTNASTNDDTDLPEQLVTPILSARVARADATNGWVLEGYPKTRSHALALQSAGILPTHVLYFTNAPEGSFTNLSESDSAALSSYQRSSSSIQDIFSSQSFFCDLSLPLEEIITKVTNLLNTPPKSNAPKRPMRVILLGPRGSGRSTQARKISTKYNLVHINTSDLLKAEAKRNPAFEEKIRSTLYSGILVPDALVIPLIIERLLSSDIKERGFVLDGFPRTKAQYDALQRASILPNRVVVLDLPIEEANERVVMRRIDPDTGDEYQLAQLDALAQAVQQQQQQQAGSPTSSSSPSATHTPPPHLLSSTKRDRLLHQINDHPEILEGIQFLYTSFIDELKEAFKGVVKVIDAQNKYKSVISSSTSTPTTTTDLITRSKIEIFEEIENFLRAPLNSQYAHVQALEAKKAVAGGVEGGESQSKRASIK